jgi:hypothetical protein
MLLVKRYRVFDPHARKIGGVLLNKDGTVSLTDSQARYPLTQRQIAPVVVEAPAPVPEATPAETAPRSTRRRRRG